MEKLFKLKAHGTDVRTEIMAGITTFISMVYILAVNPSMLANAGMDSGAVFTATAPRLFLFWGAVFCYSPFKAPAVY